MRSLCAWCSDAVAFCSSCVPGGRFGRSSFAVDGQVFRPLLSRPGIVVLSSNLDRFSRFLILFTSTCWELSNDVLHVSGGRVFGALSSISSFGHGLCCSNFQTHTTRYLTVFYIPILLQSESSFNCEQFDALESFWGRFFVDFFDDYILGLTFTLGQLMGPRVNQDSTFYDFSFCGRQERDNTFSKLFCFYSGVVFWPNDDSFTSCIPEVALFGRQSTNLWLSTDTGRSFPILVRNERSFEVLSFDTWFATWAAFPIPSPTNPLLHPVFAPMSRPVPQLLQFLDFCRNSFFVWTADNTSFPKLCHLCQEVDFVPRYSHLNATFSSFGVLHLWQQCWNNCNCGTCWLFGWWLFTIQRVIKWGVSSHDAFLLACFSPFTLGHSSQQKIFSNFFPTLSYCHAHLLLLPLTFPLAATTKQTL